MRKYNRYVAAGLLLSLLSFSTYAATEEGRNSSTDAVSEYDNGDSDFSANAVVEQDNDFCVSGGWKELGFSTITKNDRDSYSVTSGQPFSGINPNNQPLDKKCVRVRSGRKNSTMPMNWASDMRHVTDNIPVLSSGSYENYNGQRPTYANFAFIGILTLINKDGEIFSCPNVVVGQEGNSIGRIGNYWFMYSNYSKNILECTNSQGIEVEMSLKNSTGYNSTVRNVFKITIKSDK